MSTLMLLPSACVRDQPNSSHAALLMEQILPRVSMMTMHSDEEMHSATCTVPGPCRRDLRSLMIMVPFLPHSPTASSHDFCEFSSARSPSESFHFMPRFMDPTSASIFFFSLGKEMAVGTVRREVLSLRLSFRVMVLLVDLVDDAADADSDAESLPESSSSFVSLADALRSSSMASDTFLRYPILVSPRNTRSSSSRSSSSVPDTALSAKPDLKSCRPRDSSQVPTSFTVQRLTSLFDAIGATLVFSWTS
mmetsp:Transcript_41438/g.104493  ORF Transcript_41438/g.104493 Transcript_41438/m.104493 type:complete len:250 (+) Transcript_41438:1005-1754(+)